MKAEVIRSYTAVRLTVFICCIGMAAGRIIHRISDYNAPMAEPVRQCRAICLANHLHEEINNIVVTDECTDRPNCFMCWDYCKLLHEEKRIVRDLMCSDVICYSGCKTACKYYGGFFRNVKPIALLRTLAIPAIGHQTSRYDVEPSAT
ncbi:uncharacterized protein LOC128709252 [Anopheles marshallii]|uniref:uncharacterized protein LOC128709252 n=1 Tax=Anopheles marshallii TaxID=1521116 RepID=UPI00237A479A|nr:uncharacterized protein LOC128709252 [Anopheles marshallii]